jgi:hypothetical protein
MRLALHASRMTVDPNRTVGAADHSTDPGEAREGSDLPQILLVVGLSLFLVFLIRTAGTLLPFQALEPGWHLAVISGLLGSSVYPIVGVAMVVVAVWLDPRNPQASRWLARCRRYSYLACLGYLLILPLQFSAMLRMDVRSEIPANREMAAISTIQRQIINSRSLAELGEALARLPGSPRLPADFKRSLPEFRQEVASEIDENLRLLRQRQQQARQQRRFAEAGLFLQVVGLSLSFAWVFAAFAQWSPTTLSLRDGLHRTRSIIREQRAAKALSRQEQQQQRQEARGQALAWKQLRQQAQRAKAKKAQSQQAQPNGWFPLGRPKVKRLQSIEGELGTVDPYLGRLAALEGEGPGEPAAAPFSDRNGTKDKPKS